MFVRGDKRGVVDFPWLLLNSRTLAISQPLTNIVCFFTILLQKPGLLLTRIVCFFTKKFHVERILQQSAEKIEPDASDKSTDSAVLPTFDQNCMFFHHNSSCESFYLRTKIESGFHIANAKPPFHKGDRT